MAIAMEESSRLSPIDAPWDYYADDLLGWISHRIEQRINIERGKLAAGEEPLFIHKWDFARAVSTYFAAFNLALEQGEGVLFVGGKLQTGDTNVQERIDNLEHYFNLGEKILTYWQERRGERIAETGFLSNGAKLLDDVVNGILEGKADKLFDCGEALEGIEIGPGLMTIIGAPPGRGKTALALQCVYEAVARTDYLQAVVASLEVNPQTLLKRRLAALLDVSFDAIRFNKLTSNQRQELLRQDEFRRTLNNIGFLKPERSGLGDLEEMLGEFKRPGVLLMDYLQLFGVESATAAERAASTMATARRFCDQGWAVIGVSAIARSSYAKGDVGSFRDSSAIEYSGTSAYLLEEAAEYEDDDKKPPVREMKLRCLKNRNGPPKSLPLVFDGPQMTFTRPVNYEPAFDAFNAGQPIDDGGF